MRAPQLPGGSTAGLVAALVGAVVAIVLGLATFGVQATAAPHEFPLAVSVPPGSELEPIAERIAGQGGEAVSWHVTTHHAREMLDDKDVYGILQLTPTRDGTQISAVVSGAITPAATQAAQQILVSAGTAVSAQLPPQGLAPVPVETVHPTSKAGAVFPLAASALLWIATLVTSLLFGLLASRNGRTPTARARLAAVAAIAVLASAAVIGFAWLWDHNLTLPWQAVGFLVLVATAFAAVQGGVLRLLGLPGAPLLAVLYLTVPAVAALPPELLHPVYRIALWSWTPFRFSTETLRSLLFLDGSTPGVGTGVLVFAALAVVGLQLLLSPARSDTRAVTSEHTTAERASKA